MPDSKSALRAPTIRAHVNHEVPPGSTTVEVTLTAEGDETVVRLVHLGLPAEPVRDDHAMGWRHYLARLATVASGNDPGPDPMGNM